MYIKTVKTNNQILLTINALNYTTFLSLLIFQLITFYVKVLRCAFDVVNDMVQQGLGY